MVQLTQLLVPGAALLALANAAPSQTLKPKRDSDPLAGNLPKGLDRGVCVANDYSTDDSRKHVWEQARLSKFIDAYLNQNAREHWVTDIYKKLFPNDNAAQFDCWTKESECSVNTHTCSDFDNQNAAGLYQAYISLQNFHTFISQYLENLQDFCDASDRMVQPLALKFARPEKPDAPNAFAIASGIFGIGSALSGANPPAAGALSAFSGIAGILGELIKDPDNTPSLASSEGELAVLIDNVCHGTKDRIIKALEAVMGVPGSSEIDIPQEMKAVYDETNGSRYVHAISYLFGNGQWLLDHPTDGLSDVFDNAELRMQQGMAWQLLKSQHHAVLVINDASPCTDGNEIRDSENGYCYGLMYLNDELDNLEGGLNEVAYPLWASTSDGGLAMDKLKTYRNALDCWNSMNGAIGAIDGSQFVTGTDAPKCFFGMEVKKGTWKDYKNGRHCIELDQSFNNNCTDSEWPWIHDG